MLNQQIIVEAVDANALPLADKHFNRMETYRAIFDMRTRDSACSGTSDALRPVLDLPREGWVAEHGKRQPETKGILG